jgi:nudix-type nucleoside diphosphatase (YffH/AdpP family)
MPAITVAAPKEAVSEKHISCFGGMNIEVCSKIIHRMVTSYRIRELHILSNQWGRLQRVVFDTQNELGEIRQHESELYDAGNGAAVLLYNVRQRMVLLIRQFRVATVRNGNPSGLLVEACAGKMDGLPAEQTIIKEIWEETGYAVKAVRPVLSIYPSPGSFTERLELYVAAYEPEDKKSDGGGLKEEGEDIEVIELPFDEALSMIQSGKIRDAKTIILLQYAALNGLFSS